MIILFFIFIFYDYFYWRIIALQYFVDLCHTSTWISSYTFLSSLLNLPLISQPIPSLQVLFCFVFSFIFISWRLITLQYCSGFCHTLTWISHGFTCVPHPDPPSHLPLHPIPLGLPSAPALSTCLMHPTWAGDLFHPW